MLKNSGYWCVVLLAALAAGGVSTFAIAAAAGADAKNAVAPPRRELIYGSELMTHEEREQYRARMRGAQTAEDEARVRDDHFGAMQKRARQRGAKLPDPPPPGSPK